MNNGPMSDAEASLKMIRTIVVGICFLCSLFLSGCIFSNLMETKWAMEHGYITGHLPGVTGVHWIKDNNEKHSIEKE